MRIGSLFTGYGGLDVAAEHVFNATTAWHVEFEPYASAVLSERFPGIPNHGDITKVDWSTVEPVDILCGGSPCQSVSHAGKRAGFKDDKKSGLWFEYVRAIRSLQPRLVVFENVPGIFTAQGREGNAFEEVLGSLAACGYDAEWTCLGACNAGLEHHRHRLFVLAWKQGQEQSIVADAQLDGRASGPEEGIGVESCSTEGRLQQPERSGSETNDAAHGDGGDVEAHGTPGVQREVHSTGKDQPCERDEVLTHAATAGLQGSQHQARPFARRVECDTSKLPDLNGIRWAVDGPSCGLDAAQYEELVGLVGESEARKVATRAWKYRVMCLGNGVVPQQAVLALGVLKERMLGCVGV